jgi:hypothetical protein
MGGMKRALASRLGMIGRSGCEIPKISRPPYTGICGEVCQNQSQSQTPARNTKSRGCSENAKTGQLALASCHCDVEADGVEEKELTSSLMQ